jgi:putative endonuclease
MPSTPEPSAATDATRSADGLFAPPSGNDRGGDGERSVPAPVRRAGRKAGETRAEASQRSVLRVQERAAGGRSKRAPRRAKEALAAVTGEGQLVMPGVGEASAGEAVPKDATAGEPKGYRQRLGALGEERAAAWYTEAGYEVVARNWRCREGEIDLVAVGKGVVVFCEVKTRTSDRFGLPAEAVTPLKQARLRALATQFLRDRPQAVHRLRFDVASVRPGEVDVMEAAF